MITAPLVTVFERTEHAKVFRFPIRDFVPLRWDVLVSQLNVKGGMRGNWQSSTANAYTNLFVANSIAAVYLMTCGPASVTAPAL
jgi:hypothetical protein